MIRRIVVGGLVAVLLGAAGGCTTKAPGEAQTFAELWATTATAQQDLKPSSTSLASSTTTAASTTTIAPEDALVPVLGITDGDTIRVRLDGVSERVRVIGIDAPETGDCFAQQASSRMQSLVQSKSVRLTADPTQDDRDVYGRLLRHVWLADGRSVGELLIAGGHAREYTYDEPYQGQATYQQAEEDARSMALGIWSSGCLAPPSDAPSVPAPFVPEQSSSCDIKGNINSEGEHIYHVPGARYYDETQIDESKGERWFCTESEAQNAGWRKAKV